MAREQSKTASALWRGRNGGSAEISDRRLAAELAREGGKIGRTYTAQAKHVAWIMREAAARLRSKTPAARSTSIA